MGHDKEYPNDALSLEFPGNSVKGIRLLLAYSENPIQKLYHGNYIEMSYKSVIQ